jgi:hypothetical protein
MFPAFAIAQMPITFYFHFCSCIIPASVIRYDLLPYFAILIHPGKLQDYDFSTVSPLPYGYSRSPGCMLVIDTRNASSLLLLLVSA